MFSFFPRPKLYFLSFAIWALACVLAWFFFFIDKGASLSLGGLVGLGFPDALGADAEDTAKTAFAAAQSAAENFWFYEYFLIVIGAFVGFWMWFSPHRWQRWSVAGSALIFFVNWFLVQLDVMINEWFGTFYDLVQKALSAPNAITPLEYYNAIWTFLGIAMTYVFVASLFDFFVQHYVFRWRTSMNDFYTSHWQRLRHIEGASQRIQEDTMRFADITEDLGVNLLNSLMTLVAFLPLLWGLSRHVTELPIIGAVPHSLVFVALVWSALGTALLAVVGIRLPGLEFRNQRVEAAYRKELVYGEDDTARAAPPTVLALFANVRKNYFRLYFNYLYFNLVRIFYLQFGVMVPYLALGPTIISGAITLGVMQQTVRAFSQVESSFQYLVRAWKTIVKLLSIYKRLKAFEAAIYGDELPDIDKEFLARQGEPAE
ncbi:MAG: peptide antibiotic transporter SbmA [Rhizobiaceae bacterium]